jgi:co-chaperonin GroES (HSP10)
MENIQLNAWLVLLKLKEKQRSEFVSIQDIWKEKNIYEIMLIWEQFEDKYSIGQFVIISEHIWDKVEIEWVEYKIIKAEHILAIYNK